MSNTAVVSTPATAPVNATGNTPNQPGAEQGVKAPEAKAKPKAAPKYETSFDRVIAELNEKHGGDPEEFRKLGDIADDVQSGKVSKELGDDDDKPTTALKNPPAKKSAAEPAAEESSEAEEAEKAEQQEKAAAKRKLKVGDQEYELDEDTRDRFAQKGIAYEKRGIELAKKERATEAKLAEVTAREQEQNQLLQALATDPGAVLEELLGPKAFEKLKPWAAKQVQTEQQYEENPHLRQIQELQRERDEARGELQQTRAQEQEAKISQHEKQLVTQYQKTITDAMELGGIAKTDFTAAEMAGYMRRAAQRGIDYTPQQLAEIVRGDNMSRVEAMTNAEVTAITEARKTGDHETVLKHGQRLADMLGEQVVYALAKFHLAKMSGKQRQQPKPILDTTKVKPGSEKDAGAGKKPGYMPWDEWQDKRRARAEAIDRGEQVEEW